MLIPEIILYNLVNAFTKLVATDYATATDKTQTILSDLFFIDSNNNPLQLENFNYLEQAVALFTRTIENPRQFTVNIGYNLQRAFLPTVHIMLPQESPGRYDAIGMSEGEVKTVYYPNAPVPYEVETRVKTYRGNFDLMITSDNTSEVLLIYYFIKSMILYCDDTFEILGMHNFQITGMDIQLDPEFAPPNIFHRTLRIEFDYQSEVKIRNVRNFAGTGSSSVANALKFQLCPNIGDDYENQLPVSTFQMKVSNNYQITISGAVITNGYIKLTNKLTKVVTDIPIIINQTNIDTEFTNSLSPANYIVEINLQDFTGTLTGDVGDGITTFLDIPNTIDSFNQFIDMSKVKSDQIIINLNFN